MKIVFMGTPDFAQKSLEELYNSGYNKFLVDNNKNGIII